VFMKINKIDQITLYDQKELENYKKATKNEYYIDASSQQYLNYLYKKYKVRIMMNI
jgi:hypothetical protein